MTQETNIYRVIHCQLDTHSIFSLNRNFGFVNNENSSKTEDIDNTAMSVFNQHNLNEKQRFCVLFSAAMCLLPFTVGSNSKPRLRKNVDKIKHLLE